jgi:hypothetical protein
VVLPLRLVEAVGELLTCPRLSSAARLGDLRSRRRPNPDACGRLEGSLRRSYVLWASHSGEPRPARRNDAPFRGQSAQSPVKLPASWI